MASVKNSPLNSDPKWVIEINEILKHHIETEHETPFVSLFQVPETITTSNPEAYEPQQIGLGPIHHFRAQPYKKMEQKKLSVVRKVLQDNEIKDHKVIVLSAVRKVVPAVRSCYDMFLHDDDDRLASIFAIDGIFLLNLFHTYNSPVEEYDKAYLRFLTKKARASKEKLGDYNLYTGPDEAYPPLLRSTNIEVTLKNQLQWEQLFGYPHHWCKLPTVGLKKRLLAQDIMMVENQIPFMVLREIDGALRPSVGNSSTSAIQLSTSIYRSFCEIHSPLELCSESQAPASVDHLLHYMYYSILNNNPIEVPPPSRHTHVTPSPFETLHNLKEIPQEEIFRIFEQIIEVGDEQFYEETKEAINQVFSDDDDEMDIQKNEYSGQRPATKPPTISNGGKILDMLSKVPTEEIFQVYEHTISILETISKISKSRLIPSASKLQNKAGFKFYNLPKHYGIQNIFMTNTKDIFLPPIGLEKDSEVILRNLVAYEILTTKSDRFPLTEYMRLMCALILTKDDVMVLKNVIKGDLSENKVVKIFTGLSSSIPAMKIKNSDLKYKFKYINHTYNSTLRMWIFFRLQRVAFFFLGILTRIRVFMEASWKVVAFMVSIVTMFFLTMQAYCDVYGCNKTTVSLSYA